MFPWQSGSSGREETQVVHLNPLTGEWGDDYSSLQRHVSLAIAYNLWNYFHTTLDTDFMISYGAELLFEICKFWSSKCTFDNKTGKFHIAEVMGPDEYHESLPGDQSIGLSDNAYTNIMVVWMLEKALSLKNYLPEKETKALHSRLGISESEINRWMIITEGVTLNISKEGIVEQFKGYFGLKELDWESYRDKYGDIHRLDRILKAEGNSPDSFKLAKQADFLMTIFNLGESEVRRIIEKLGYGIGDDFSRINYNYYIARTSHGSTLSRLVHSTLAFKLGLDKEGWRLYMEALRSDIDDIQGGTTGEGIHCGVMTGTVYMVTSVFGGIDLSGDYPVITPHLPLHWDRMSFSFLFRSIMYKVDIDHQIVNIIAVGGGKEKIKVNICNSDYVLEADKKETISI
jgi:trehalose/maltose hydrolase-like predicted phosphorylase